MAETKAGSSKIVEAAQALAAVRGRACLVFDAPFAEAAVRAVAMLLPEGGGGFDVLLRSPGGCSCCAYVMARELRRRFAEIAVFVPLGAKSAATLVALAADELVLGDLGELGPLDAQFYDRQRADFPVDRSRLEVLEALGQLKEHALSTFDGIVRAVVENSGMKGEDVCKIGLEFAVKLCQPLYAQINPLVLGQSRRSLDTGAAYAERILRRYRSKLWADNGPKIVERLVRSYPDHGFVIDREELEEIGLPVRPPTHEELGPMERATVALLAQEEVTGLIELVEPPRHEISDDTIVGNDATVGEEPQPDWEAA